MFAILTSDVRIARVQGQKKQKKADDRVAAIRLLREDNPS
jgi:hypothetical protein